MRLISFLGTGDYHPTSYLRPDTGRVWETPYIALALAKLWKVSETHILATEKALGKHRTRLEESFEAVGLDPPRFVTIPDGKKPGELWQHFEEVRALLAVSGRPVILDITHGYRIQPFFAGAVVDFVRSVIPDAPEIQVVYGAFEAQDQDQRAPIWDLTAFTELVEWTRSLSLFRKTGHAGLLARQVEALGRKVRAEWAESKHGEPPRLTNLARVLKGFNEALATVRIGDLLLPNDKHTSSLARRLLEAIRAAAEDITAHIPPLAPVLDKLEEMLIPLQLEDTHLSGHEGRRAMAKLARLYFDFERYAEAGIALREGWVNLYAPPQATTPGESFDEGARQHAEKALSAAGQTERELMGVRNDLEHGGFRRRPLPPQTIRSMLERYLCQLEHADVPRSTALSDVRHGRIWLVTRHKGAVDWVRRNGVCVDRLVDHLDVEEIARGDMVIGVLPFHLAARVCARGARFFSLSLEVPPDYRGQELDADDLERFGARLEEYRVERVAADEHARP